MVSININKNKNKNKTLIKQKSYNGKKGIVNNWG